MPVQPTQTKHPWRATARTVFAVVVALASLLPELVLTAGIPAERGVAQVLAVAAVITRMLAMPAVDQLLREHFPWLAAAPKEIAPMD